MTLEQALISDPGVGDDSRTSLDIRPWGGGDDSRTSLDIKPWVGDGSRTNLDIRPWGRRWL